MPNAPDLHVHSMFSTYDGFGSPQAVVDRAVQLGWGAVCLSEHGWMGSAPWLYQAAKKAGIKPIIACELYITPDDYLIDGDKDVLTQRRHLTALALSYEGYVNLVHWSNASMQRPHYYNGPRLSMDLMAEIAPHPLHHNVILSGCMGGELCQCLLHQNGNADLAARLYLEQARDLFPNFYVELMNHTTAKFFDRGFKRYESMVIEQALVRNQLLDLAQDLEIPVIVTNDSHFQSQEQRKPHIAMLARKGNKRNRQTTANFTEEYAYWSSYQRSMEEIAATLPKWAEEEAIQSIHAIVEEADVTLHPLDKFSYTLPRSPYDNPVDEIRRRSKARLKNMVARHGAVAQERFDYELEAMADFAHYLLIYSDIVRMARSQGIYTWTRGSAANSLVCFCLKIHEIDPIHYKLLFERFVNPARAKFPDVDIDIESVRRQDVVKMVTEYLAETEGTGNVLPICTYSTLANRNVFRLAAEAAGVPAEKIDEYSKLLPQMIDSGMVESDEEAYAVVLEELGIDIYRDAAALFDSLGGISQHACALVLGTDERRLADWVPGYRIGSSDTLVTQYNMKWIEEMGFQKLDLLTLDTLTILHDVARMLGKDIEWIDQLGQAQTGIYNTNDPKTYEMLRAGRTEGVHSMQGKTQRRGCIEIAVENDDDLIAVQALYRPSGTRTGLDKAFVNRKHGREDWASINPFVGGYLDETFGIAIFQEQIMEMGFGMGMSGAEIDDLYKAIKTAKGVGRGARELFEKFEPTFRRYADDLWPKSQADEIWAEWEKLQGYCVTGDTTVEKGDGQRVTVKELHDIWNGPITAQRKKWRSKHPKRGLWLTAYRDRGIFLDRCIGVIDNGVREVWTVTLRDGKSITATANHPLLTDVGWRLVGQIEIGEHVVIDTGDKMPYYKPTGYGVDWAAKTTKRAFASDGRLRPVLHGDDARLRAVTKLLNAQMCWFCGAQDVRFERAHLNHDRTDNSVANVVLACSSCHKKHDYKTGKRQGRWSRGRVAWLSDVVEVEYAGKQRTFDLVMQGDEHNFIANGIVAHNTFNRGHATSYGILAYKTAFVRAHHPQELFTALLNRYPGNPRFLAAALAEGYKFEAPDINLSTHTFSKGSDDKSIRVGFAAIAGIGPGAAGELVRNQPFSSVADIKERTNGQRVKAPTIEALRALGALESLGIRGDKDDAAQYRYLGMVLGRPDAFKGCKPSLGRRRSGRWEFSGLERGVDITEGKRFCAKLLWIPPDAPLVTKTSGSGHYNAHLLSVVDENGIPFDLTCGTQKEHESEMLSALAACPGAVVCVEGQIGMPFERGASTAFKFWGVSGAESDNPQLWHAPLEAAEFIIEQSKRKVRSR